MSVMGVQSLQFALYTIMKMTMVLALSREVLLWSYNNIQ